MIATGDAGMVVGPNALFPGRSAVSQSGLAIISGANTLRALQPGLALRDKGAAGTSRAPVDYDATPISTHHWRTMERLPPRASGTPLVLG